MNRKFVLATTSMAVLVGMLMFGIQPSTLVKASTLTPRFPILIDGDSQFTPINGVTGGSGTALDPFVIEGWDINAETANGIEVRNTTAYFIIRNVTIHDGQPNGYHGLLLQNVTHGIVTNVISTNNIDLLFLSSVSNTKALNNTAVGHGVITVTNDSRNNVIAFNYLDGGGWGCIFIDGEYNDVVGNTVTNWGNGIGIGGKFNNVSGNKISPPGTWYALWVGSGASNNTIQGNDVSGGGEGISFDVGYNNTIMGNHVHDTGAGVGIVYGNPAIGNYFIGNMIENNAYGIYIGWEGWGDGPSHDNFFYNNYLNNSCNTYDGGTNNWNTSKSIGSNILGGPYLGGNYYSDYTGTDVDSDGIGETPYYIGGGNSLDYLPLVQASGTIYIRADGSIDPPTAPMEALENVTYRLTGDISTSSDGIVIERNDITIDGAQHSVNGSGEGHGIDLTGRNGVTVGNTSVSNFHHGICLSNTQNTTLSKNDIANNGHGIHLDFSSDNFVCGNNIRANNFSGIYLYFSDNNSVCGNNVVESLYGGMYLWSSANNNVSGNNVSANAGSGIGLEYGCSNNSISENNITNNSGSIILYYSSSGNKFLHNNFINNTHKVYLNSSGANVWDDGYASGGNYWSDYSGTDANHDGIGDTPYIIDANNTDHYPLMTIIPEFPTFLILPLFFTLTLLAVTIYRRKHFQND